MDKIKFSIKTDFYPLLKLAIPLVLNSLLGSVVFFFVTLFLAKLGPEVLAAGALVGWLTNTLLIFIFGILNSINILVAHEHGADNKHNISLIARDGIYLAILFVIPTLLLFWNISSIFILLGQNQFIALNAEHFMHAWAWGLLPQFISVVLVEIMIGLGEVQIILVVTSIQIILNVFFNYVFIFGKFGLPALGITGAGWGVAVTSWISTAGFIIFLIVKKEYHCYFKHLTKFTKPSYLMELLKVGMPLGFMYSIEIAFFLVLALLMGTYGANVLAANQIVMQYYVIFISVTFAIAQAITVRMGHLLGAGDIVSAKTAGFTGVGISGLFMAIAACFLYFIPSSLTSIDVDLSQTINSQIIYFATQFFSVCALFQIFEGCRFGFFGALRALKDTHFTLCISIISFWGIALPLGYLFATHLNFGEVGFWWGMVCGTIFSVILLAWRFKLKIRDCDTLPVITDNINA